MTILNVDDSLMLIVDIQEKLLNAVFNKEMIKKNSYIMSNLVLNLNIPTFITEQYPKGLGNTIDEIKATICDGCYYEKTAFNAIDDIKLKNDIKNLNKKHIIVAGIETHICVYQTVNCLLENGYEVSVINDMCGSRAESEYYAGLDIMKQNGAQIKTTEMVLFEFLRSSKHPLFKNLQSLIKS